MRLLAIDPGNTHSAYMIIDDDLRPYQFDKLPNEELVWLIQPSSMDQVVIEQIGHYGTGMPAGQTVFDTCIWIGRFYQHILDFKTDAIVNLVMRRDVKLHLTGSVKANDGNIIQALVDRFAPDERNRGKGIKNNPGWFYGFHADIWQAYALAVYYMDKHLEAAVSAQPP